MHITNGTSAAGVLKQALGISKSEFLVVNDVLSCGPLQAITSIDDWMSYRQAYWNDVQKLCGIEPLVMQGFDRDLYVAYEELQSSDRIDVWVGTALSDQVMLCFLVFLFEHLGIDFSRVFIHQFSKVEGVKYEIHGLGMLNHEKVLSADTSYQLTDCWYALVSSTPELYIKFIQEDKKDLPFLVCALKYLVYRYPNKQTGLSIWDESILRNTLKAGPKAAKIIGFTLSDAMDGCDLTGDLYQFTIMKKLGNENLNQPLLSLNRQDGDMRETRVDLTEIGKQVLNGELNAIELNGINEWVCGVHLNSLDNTLWQGQNGVILT
ncbi:DUF1835 domain-containing protein [Endozoicomonas sp. SM1973]|uniref:DUF1835 domain-containing protein n=1 Tax=Spartinivicinus marinus TaxID=2994442 RepID=A0A853I992_9GAMM|nr:DUF1835 domain-containing protein [Spartinivicinus marinus]MCX4027668.1 DUF1835 domain-containing protein [Spartinivicinus marinus]NYZ66634.1 DUF1835 domain-containing protein [Spartinivicinus marinus]